MRKKTRIAISEKREDYNEDIQYSNVELSQDVEGDHSLIRTIKLPEVNYKWCSLYTEYHEIG